MVRSQKTNIYDKVRELLPLLFSTGLSKGLTEVGLKFLFIILRY